MVSIGFIDRATVNEHISTTERSQVVARLLEDIVKLYFAHKDIHLTSTAAKKRRIFWHTVSNSLPAIEMQKSILDKMSDFAELSIIDC